MPYEPRPEAGAITIERNGDSVTIRVAREAHVSWVLGTLLSLIGSAMIVVMARALWGGLRGTAHETVVILVGLLWAGCLILGAVMAFRPPRPEPEVMTATPQGFVYRFRRNNQWDQAAYETYEIGDFFVRPARQRLGALNTHELGLRLVDGQEWVIGLGPPHEVGRMVRALREGLGLE